MSLRETIVINHPLRINKFLQIIEIENGARGHPAQPGAFLVGDPELPFYAPEKRARHVFILGFNYAPLPVLLLHTFINHAELVPENTRIRWTAEQDLLWQGTIQDLHRIFRNVVSPGGQLEP